MVKKINKSFLIGAAVGIGGYVFIKELNKSLKPYTIKAMEKVLYLGDKTKELVDDIKDEVEKSRHKLIKEENQDIGLEHCAVTCENTAQEELLKLQAQIQELEEKMKKLNNRG
ncbi:YtxH domain-containing protein [Caloramator sp. mosi_1]|uniref:YtxH domain-containing protein n=1 Tax=Caloramator sp. mosi_1 TaxID=3023090 RepID=UPI002362AC9B|nr:YtxH domain-containing protein [Caloramator sp. mosi_1]WDC85255.1 YtxH domain-containing protein [Caloramator sp. mosi_1]